MPSLQQEFTSHTASFVAWTDTLTHDTADRPDGKWTLLEMLEHVFISEKGTARLMQIPASPVVRDLEESRARMATPLAQLSRRYQGGAAIEPKGRFNSYAEWRQAFLSNRDTILQAYLLGADGLCEAFPHPHFGNLTRAEWTVFVMLHADRHRAQWSQAIAQP